MSDLTPFKFDGHEVRVVDLNGVTAVVAKDVAEALDYEWNGAARIAHIPEEWKGVTSVVTPRGKQEMAVLTEQGLYFFLGRSDKPKALPFQKWIAGDVLPSIRKTGSYTAQPVPAKPARRNAPSLLTDVRAIDLIGNMIAKVPGARPDVVAAIKLRMIEDRTGLPVTQFQGALPAESIEKAVKLNPTAIGKRLVPNMSATAVNKTLIRLGLQKKSEKGYVLTEEGTAYGESRPYQADNNHVGDQINWYESVVSLISSEMAQPAPSNQGQLLGMSGQEGAQA